MPARSRRRVEISASRCGSVDGNAEVSVKDSGVGIPRHLLKSIFEAFVQGDQDIARSQGGLGLGLSLVRQIVLRHGGQVAAYSTGQPGKGSEFVISLPSIAAPTDSAVAIVPPEASASRKVLIVDDNQDAAETMRVVLSAFGYRACVVHDGITALRAIKRNRPDVVLLDIGLPGPSGLEVAERIGAELARPPPLIAITGYDQDSDREASLKAGFQAHITKPVDLAELTHLLTQLLG